jgi:transposase
LRSKIILACADGGSNTAVADRLRCDRMTVGKWRARFLEHRLDGLLDEPRTGRPPSISVDPDIRAWVKAWNDNPKPLVWTKTADEILARLGRLIRRTSNPGH